MTTASVSALPIEPFKFAHAEEWPKWIKRFERFRTVTGLNEKSETLQIDALVFYMGEQAEDVITSLGLSETDKVSYKAVIKAFDNHFVIKKNVVYERFVFFSRSQTESETVEEFVTTLHALAEHCNFKTLKDELIRDRIVGGVRDKQLSERLQLISDLTLEKAITMAKQSEQVKKQNQILHGVENEVKVNRINTRQNRKKEFWQQKVDKTPKSFDKTAKSKVGNSLENKTCRRCGKDFHYFKDCPAANLQCHKCNKKGHFSKCCQSKTVQGVNSLKDTYIGTVGQDNSGPNEKWCVTVSIKNTNVDCKADTGAEITCISSETYHKFFAQIKLNKPERLLLNASKAKMKTQGYFCENVHYRGKTALAEIYVVDNLGQMLLDGGTCEKLGILKRIESIEKKISFDPKKKFSKLFEGLGKVKIPYRIKLKEDAKPRPLTTPRRVPIPMLKEIKENLDNMVQLGVIEPVEEPTEWCSGLVLAPKANGKIRMCVDYIHLNKYVQREIHPMPSTENILGRLGKAKFFSKMDANNGFWQCQLDEDSQLLTTFITPYGRYKFKRLPFGINAGPEFFQKRMAQILEGLDGVQVNIDDMLVYAQTREEHDTRLMDVMKRLSEAEVTLNYDKCVFGVTEIKFLGHIINESGIRIDPGRIEAIKKMDRPENISELRSLLGSVNYLGRFIPNLASKAHPLNELLSGKNEFNWGQPQTEAFDALKEELAKEPVLALFDPNQETIITADASQYGVGAVLKQRQSNGKIRPIAYASKTLTSHQKNWAQIEKEGYALVWACDRFKDFIIGLKVNLETDHKPLVPIFTTKELDEITPKLQRMRLRLSGYSYNIMHIPGKELGAADMLSRRPLPRSEPDTDLDENINAYVHMITSILPATDARLGEIIVAQTNDHICKLLREYSRRGWPEKQEMTMELKPYWKARTDITVQEGLVMKGSRIVIPAAMRQEILSKLHEGHLGIVKCRARARESVWWPGVSKEIEEYIKKCSNCVMESTNLHEPLIPSEFPKRPWQKVGMDLLYLERTWYLLVMDYYSRYPEIAKLSSLKEVEVILHLKSMFARHGTPELVYCDGGTHFAPLLTSTFSQFAKEWGFARAISSPKFPQSNGFAEAGVKLVKRCMKKSEDPYVALQSYRATPLENGFSPAELLMGRKLRTSVPMKSSLLNPKTPDPKDLAQKEEKRRNKQKTWYDRRHGVRDLKELTVGDKVWITDLRRTGIIKGKSGEPRSYIVDTEKRTVRRNRFHLIPFPDENESETLYPFEDEDQEPMDDTQLNGQEHNPEQNPQVRQSGRQRKKPERLIEQC